LGGSNRQDARCDEHALILKGLVFIDETWASTNKRLLAYTPFGHWKTTTFVAALRCDRITAPCVFDGPINGETFLA
jgi:hypothetical protein